MYWLAGNRRCNPPVFVEHGVDTTALGALLRKVFFLCFSVFKIPILALLPYGTESQKGALFQFFSESNLVLFSHLMLCS